MSLKVNDVFPVLVLWRQHYCSHSVDLKFLPQSSKVLLWGSDLTYSGSRNPQRFYFYCVVVLLSMMLVVMCGLCRYMERVWNLESMATLGLVRAAVTLAMSTTWSMMHRRMLTGLSTTSRWTAVTLTSGSMMTVRCRVWLTLHSLSLWQLGSGVWCVSRYIVYTWRHAAGVVGDVATCVVGDVATCVWTQCPQSLHETEPITCQWQMCLRTYLPLVLSLRKIKLSCWEMLRDSHKMLSASAAKVLLTFDICTTVDFGIWQWWDCIVTWVMLKLDASQRWPCVGSGVVRIDQLRFLARCCIRRPNQALSVLSLSLGFLWLCC